MRSSAYTSFLAGILIVSLLAPSALIVIPRSAHAQDYGFGVPTGEVPVSTLSLKSILTEINTWLTEANTYAQYINTYVLQPAALIKSGNLLKAMTSGVITFVTGQANGTGAAQFVQNLQGNLQRVGDTQAMAFFAQFGRNSNSPFASAIVSSLRTNYLQNTSAAGFWGANRSTLSLASPNINAFLAGNWSQGGAKAWFALTTQTQNNPYTLYQASQAQLSSVVGGATAARLASLNWGQGFLSWCGPVPAGTDTESMDAAPVGDPCIQSDGTPGVIKTPGSVISSSLAKTLGANQDKLVQIGSVAKDIGGIMSNLASIWQTVQFAKEVLGGSNSGGLYGLGQNISSNSNTRANNPSAGGPGPTDPVNTAHLTQLSGRIEQFASAWSTINTSAENASTSIQSLIDYCVTQPDAPKSASTISAAQTALKTIVAPVFVKVTQASATIAAARATLAAATSTTSQTLTSVPPTGADVAAAQYSAQSQGGSTANPAGSLTVTGGSTVDQMNLLATNASSLKEACTPPGMVPPGGPVDGGGSGG